MGVHDRPGFSALCVVLCRLHAAGVEVLLDVAYNHTAEGGDEDPYVISLRGLENSTYYMMGGGNVRVEAILIFFLPGSSSACNCNAEKVMHAPAFLLLLRSSPAMIAYFAAHWTLQEWSMPFLTSSLHYTAVAVCRC